jgi:M6 family metalloprotease-like protein
MGLFRGIHLIALFLWASWAQAAVYNGLEVTSSQPDGSTIRTRVYGDEFHAVMEHQGFTVVMDRASRALCYARLEAGALVSTGVWAGKGDPVALGCPPRLRPSPAIASKQSLARRQAWGVEEGNRWGGRARAMARGAVGAGAAPAPPSHTSTGVVVGLAIMVDFPDVQGSSGHLGMSDGLFNTIGFSGDGNSGSVRQYFQEVSKNKLDFSNVVGSKAFVRMPKSKDWYNYIDGDKEKGLRDAGESGPMLVKDAFEVLNALNDDDRMKTYGLDYSTLTTWTDGTIKAVTVMYAGETSGVWSQGLWPHMMPAEARAIDIALPGTGSGKRVRTYQITNLGSSLTIGTISHECGHMVCDFPDLYDYGSVTNGVGAYCLMDIGSYGNNGRTPIRVSGYLRYMAGWYDETDVVDIGRLGASAWGRRSIDVNGIYLFAKGGKALTSSTSEFFLIEHRVRAGWDAAIPDEGMAIWHIDTASSNSTNAAAYKGHNEAFLVQADNRDDLGLAVNYGDDTDLFPNGAVTSFSGSSSPAATLWDGSDSGMMITEIGQPQAVMTFRIGQPEPYFAQQPQKVMGRPGKTVLLTARVISDPAASIFWERLAPNSASWKAIVGANSEYYAFTIAEGDVGSLFRCTATNAYGMTLSNSVELVYEPLPSENVAIPVAPGATGHAIPPPVSALPAGGGSSGGCGVGSGLGMILLGALLALGWRLRRGLFCLL